MPPPYCELDLARLETELSIHVGTATTGADVRDVLQQALRDLKGSVSGDSLPEMVARLAATRLSAVEPRTLAAV